MFQAAVVLQGVQNFDARLPLQGIGQQQAAPRTQHRGHALDEELGPFEGGAGLDAEDEVEGILGPWPSWPCSCHGAAMAWHGMAWHGMAHPTNFGSVNHHFRTSWRQKALEN